MREALRRMPPELLGATIQWLSGLRNDTVDMREPQVRASMSAQWLHVLILYALIPLLGLLLNLKCVLRLLHSRDITDKLVLTLCCCNLLIDSFVLIPTTVALLSHSWLLGRTMCFLLPIIQDMSLQLTVLLHLLLIVDRYQLAKASVRLPVVLAPLGTVLLTVGLVLPYQPYIAYADLQNYMGSQFEGVAICVSNLSSHMRIYSAVLILITYVLPALVMAALYWRMRVMTRMDVAVMYQGTDITYSHRVQGRQEGRGWVSIQIESRAQHCLGLMAFESVLCLLPLMLIRMYKLGNAYAASLDLVYCASIWLAFLPTILSPLIYLRYLNNKKNPPLERADPCSGLSSDKI